MRVLNSKWPYHSSACKDIEAYLGDYPCLFHSYFIALPASIVIVHSHIASNAGTLLWVYRQYIAMPFIALARQAWIYRDISDSLGTHL